jgi:DHA2 family multidrug resistance protein-like MFS transporter
VSKPSMLVAGLLLSALAFALMTQIGGPSSLAIVVAASIVMSFGLAPVFTLTTDFVVGAAPPERAGAAAAISETGAEFGGALGIAVLGSIGAAVYRGLMADAMPADLPAAAGAVAQDTLGGAVGVAETLGEPSAAALLAAAHGAFTDGYILISTIGTVVMLATALLVFLLLRRPSGGGSGAEPALERP